MGSDLQRSRLIGVPAASCVLRHLLCSCWLFLAKDGLQQRENPPGWGRHAASSPAVHSNLPAFTTWSLKISLVSLLRHHSRLWEISDQQEISSDSSSKCDRDEKGCMVLRLVLAAHKFSAGRIKPGCPVWHCQNKCNHAKVFRARKFGHLI